MIPEPVVTCRTSDGGQCPPIRVRYKNYKGDESIRTIRPRNLYFGSNKWHPEPQWLLDAYDIQKMEMRTFALKDMIPTGEVLI